MKAMMVVTMWIFHIHIHFLWLLPFHVLWIMLLERERELPSNIVFPSVPHPATQRLASSPCILIPASTVSMTPDLMAMALLTANRLRFVNMRIKSYVLLFVCTLNEGVYRYWWCSWVHGTHFCIHLDPQCMYLTHSILRQWLRTFLLQLYCHLLHCSTKWIKTLVQMFALFVSISFYSYM